MNSRVLSYISVIVCVVLGTTILALRYHSRESAKQAEEESLWSLTYAIDFEPVELDATIEIYIPYDTPHCEVRVLKPSHQGLRSERRGNRIVATAPTTGGPYRINAEFELRLSPQPVPSRVPAMEYLSPNARARYLRAEAYIPVDSNEVRSYSREVQDAGKLFSSMRRAVSRAT